MTEVVPTPRDAAYEAAERPNLPLRIYRSLKARRGSDRVIELAKGIAYRHFWAPKVCRDRVNAVLASPDFSEIPKHADAGQIVDGMLVMHNGLRVEPTSYYGNNMLYVFQNTQGVHEPREERVFGELLRHIPPGSVMIELGSFWAFYSIWFLKSVQDPVSIMVEPDRKRMSLGVKNCGINGVDGTFVQAYVGSSSAVAEDGIDVVGIDDLCKTLGIGEISLLHADIQGAEADMLRGATGMISAGKIDYTFVSTHGSEIHAECRDILTDADFEILEDIPGGLSDSKDGLLFARRSGLDDGFVLP